MHAKIKIWKLRTANRWVAARIGGVVFIMGHSWENVCWQLQQYVLLGKL